MSNNLAGMTPETDIIVSVPLLIIPLDPLISDWEAGSIFASIISNKQGHQDARKSFENLHNAPAQLIVEAYHLASAYYCTFNPWQCKALGAFVNTHRWTCSYMYRWAESYIIIQNYFAESIALHPQRHIQQCEMDWLITFLSWFIGIRRQNMVASDSKNTSTTLWKIFLWAIFYPQIRSFTLCLTLIIQIVPSLA